MEQAVYRDDAVYCPQLQEDYQLQQDTTIVHRFNNFYDHGFAYEQTRRSNNRTNEKTRKWLQQKFDQ